MPRAKVCRVRKPTDVQLGPTMTPDEVAADLRVAVGTLKNWRAEGKGPAYIPLTDGKRPPIRYLATDVSAFKKSRRTA